MLLSITAWNTRFNDWLAVQFGISLFLADGWTGCSGNELMNIPAEQTPYTAMFRRVSAAIARRKLCRYTPNQLRQLNAGQTDAQGRECPVCGRSDHLVEGGRCFWCNLFVELSAKVLDCPVYLVSSGKSGADFVLPGFDDTRYICLADEKTAQTQIQDGGALIRAYTKNQSFLWLPNAVRLSVGDYAFSRQMSLFFKERISSILRVPKPDGSRLSVAIVYSGGDDVFLVGAWNDVIDAALRIESAFRVFCGGALTISAGISLHDDHFPIRQAAAQSAELEDRAKQMPGKNALALFTPEEEHTYPWKEFREKVLNEKLQLLRDFFRADEQVNAGTVFAESVVYDASDETQLWEDFRLLAKAMKLLQMDYLGGHGSRGSGRVSLKNFRVSCYGEALDCTALQELFNEVAEYELLPVSASI